MPGLDPSACRAYALEPGVRFQKGAPWAYFRLRHRSVDDLARRADVSARTIKRASRSMGWAPELQPAIADGSLSLREAERIIQVRIERAERWKSVIADAFAKEGQDEQARLCRAQAIDRPERLWRWLRSLVMAYSDGSEDLIVARGACGAAVLGYDPMEQ